MPSLFTTMLSDSDDVSHKRFIALVFGLVTLLILVAGLVALFFGKPAAGFCALAGVSGGITSAASGFSTLEKFKSTVATTETSKATTTTTEQKDLTATINPWK